jgi:hypothetical protein
VQATAYQSVASPVAASNPFDDFSAEFATSAARRPSASMVFTPPTAVNFSDDLGAFDFSDITTGPATTPSQATFHKPTAVSPDEKPKPAKAAKSKSKSKARKEQSESSSDEDAPEAQADKSRPVRRPSIIGPTGKLQPPPPPGPPPSHLRRMSLDGGKVFIKVGA